MNIVVKWDKMGSEFSYCIWYAKNPNGPWIRDNDIRLTDDVLDILLGISLHDYSSSGSGIGYNTYTIRGLDAEKKYSIKVTCHDRYDAWWYSYNGPEELSGGLGAPETRPNPDGGNIIGFQFEIGS